MKWLRLLFLSGICILAGCGSGIESGGISQKVTINSTTLHQRINVNIYTPPGYDASVKYPVLFMIHGYGSNEDCWLGLGICPEANKLINQGKIQPLIIVAPDIKNSWGLNSNFGRFEDYLSDELIRYIDDHYSTNPSREYRWIGGLSMGGYVSLYIAFSHPDLFSRVGGHSPGIILDSSPNADFMHSWLYPDETLRHQRDPIYLAQEKDLTGLTVYLDCGDQDSFRYYEGCAQLYDILQSKGVASENHVYPGAHDGAYWRSHMDEYLMFYAGI